MIKKNIKPEDIVKFKEEIDEISAKISLFISENILDKPGITVESIVYSLLSVASLIAITTDCKKITYTKLADVAYDNELKDQRITERDPSLN